MTIAIYPGTFDPITHGHTDIVTRAARLFPEVVVGVAEHSTKKTLFDVVTRVSMVKTVLAHLPNVRVSAFSGLLVQFAQEIGSRVILRGLRVISDFEYEFQLANANRKLHPDIETIFLTAAEPFTYLSSSLVREISALGGDISPFVHPHIASMLSESMKR